MFLTVFERTLLWNEPFFLSQNIQQRPSWDENLLCFTILFTQFKHLESISSGVGQKHTFQLLSKVFLIFRQSLNAKSLFGLFFTVDDIKNSKAMFSWDRHIWPKAWACYSWRRIMICSNNKGHKIVFFENTENFHWILKSIFLLF